MRPVDHKLLAPVGWAARDRTQASSVRDLFRCSLLILLHKPEVMNHGICTVLHAVDNCATRSLQDGRTTGTQDSTQDGTEDHWTPPTTVGIPASPALLQLKGTWCNGTTPAEHAGSPGFNPRCARFLRPSYKKSSTSFGRRLRNGARASALGDRCAGERVKVCGGWRRPAAAIPRQTASSAPQKRHLWDSNPRGETPSA